MATFTITSGTGILSLSDDSPAFANDSPGPDTLVVESGGFIVQFGGGAGALLAATGIWTVNVNGSIFSASNAGLRLAAGISGVSAITVGADGEIGGGGGNANAAAIVADSTVNIKNAGVISGGQLFSWAIALGAGNDRLTNTGQIIGSVDLGGGNDVVKNAGEMNGFDLGEGNNKLTNTGSIIWSVTAGSGNDIVVNSGAMRSLVLGEGDNQFTNTGGVALNVSAGAGDDIVVNRGNLGGHVGLGDGNNTLHNFKTIANDASAGSGNDTFINSGTIRWDVLLGDGKNKFTNSGTVGDDNPLNGNVSGGVGKDTVINTNVIRGNVDLGGGANKLINSGMIGQSYSGGSGADRIENFQASGKKVKGGTILGDLDLGSGKNTVINAGTIKGDILAGGGADTVVNFVKNGKKTVAGTISGEVDLGAGNDVFKGGSKAETVRDGPGADTYKLGGGKDIYKAKSFTAGVDGNDTINGGKGIDTYDASDATSRIIVNLDSVAHDRGPFNPGVDMLAANRAIGLDVSGSATDTVRDNIFNFENVTGGSGNDTIYGNKAANKIEGGGGDDVLHGFGGKDTLIGGTGTDLLHGGAGRDILWGGNEFASGDGTLDYFAFTSIKDSGTTKKTRDVIMDFEDGLDRIHLIHIDANVTNNIAAADDSFTFIGTNVSFTGAAGQLRVYATASGWIVDGDVTGNGKPDFSIEVIDPNHAISWSAADFFGVI